MMGFFRNLFDTSDFPARWHCGNWSTGLGWLHIASDVAIWGAYLAIPCVLLYFVRKRRDVPFHWVFYFFGLFIVSCGTTHLIEAGLFWWPAYRLSGLAKLVTALVSWATVVALVPILPRALELPGIVRLNAALEREVKRCSQVQTKLEAYTNELERANRELVALRQAADQANRSKSEFLASMSHEIRTPMTAILGYTDELLRHTRPGDDPERLDALRTIRENGDHLLAIVNDILDLSKIEAGRFQVVRRSVALPKLVAEIDSLMGVLARRKGVVLRIGFDGPVPVRIDTDPTRLKQVLVNLTGNGLKYTDRGEVRLTVRLRHDGEASRLEFEVRDTGVGMSGDDLTRIFQPYARAQDGDARGGTGLGLVISRRIVEMLGGTIEVRSTPGLGTIFTASIDPGPLDGVPMIEPTPETIGTLTPFDLDTITGPDIALPAGLRVLVAEDAVSNQRLISRLLREVEVEPVIVNDGIEAIEAVEEAMSEGRDYNLILMDMLMPNLGGLDAAARLRALGCRTPIVALTANAMDGDRERYLRAGCDGYVSKPIDRAELLEVIARLSVVSPDRDEWSGGESGR